MEIQKKGIIEKIINLLLNIFIFVFSVILLISIYNNVQMKLFGKEYSDFFGYSIFEVQTGSMVPEINPGDWIIVKSTNNIVLKDIITYNQDGEYITHRVIGKVGGTYVTKGDANNSKDDPIDEKQIVGKVVKILPNFGILKKTIFNPVVLVAIIITMLICNFVFKTGKKEEKSLNEPTIKNKILTFVNELKKTLKQIKDKQKLKEEVHKVEDKKEEKNEEKVEITVQNVEPVIEEQVQDEEMVEEISSYIPVDVSELDDTFLEIAQNEIEEQTKIEVKKEIEKVVEEKETPTKLNLELLENTKKSKNLLDKFISIKVEEMNEIINILDDDGKTYVNEPTIKNKLMSSYIDAKYYNYYGDTDVSENRKQSLKIEKYMIDVAELMKKKYKGSDTKYSEKVDRFLTIFSVISNLECARDSITDKKAKEEFYKKELTKYAKNYNWSSSKIKSSISDIIKIQRNYVGILEYLFKKLETNMFDLEFNKLKVDKNMYGISLQHNITFGKVYSDYIIDKTYNEGVIAENKIIILLNLLSIRLIRDMIESEFNRKYIVYFPKTLYSKEKKLEKILRMIDDEHAKESIIILVKLEHLLKHKTIIKKLKKEGYQFAININSDTKLEEKNYNTMNIVDYIFVDKKIPNIVKILSSLPEDLADKLIYEDIIEKIGDFGGE